MPLGSATRTSGRTVCHQLNLTLSHTHSLSLSLPLHQSMRRFGLRGRPFLSAVGQAMLQMGGTFGFVMSVGTERLIAMLFSSLVSPSFSGSGLRCEEPATAAAASSSGANAPLSAIARAHRPMVQRDD